MERHIGHSLHAIGTQQPSIICCLIVFGYPLLRDEGWISGCSSGVQSSQFFGAAHRPKPQCQSALNNSSIFSSVVSCSVLFFMTKNFLFMTKRLWQSGSKKLSFMTRRRKKKKGLQAATKWSLRRGWWQMCQSLCSKLSAAKSGVKTCTVCLNCRFHSFS